MEKPLSGRSKSFSVDFRFKTELPASENFSPLVLEILPSKILMEFLSPKVLVGRHSKADFRLPSFKVSRHHCLLLFKDGQWYVCDLGSRNGTLLDGMKVEVAPIKDASILEIGDFHFRVKSASRIPLNEMVQNLRLAG